MAFIEYGGQRFPVPAGEMVLGSGAGCHLRLERPGIALRHAVLVTGADESVAIRVADEGAVVEVNGDFFGRRVLPMLIAQEDGEKSSPSSSQPGTDAPTSTATP